MRQILFGRSPELLSEATQFIPATGFLDPRTLAGTFAYPTADNLGGFRIGRQRIEYIGTISTVGAESELSVSLAANNFNRRGVLGSNSVVNLGGYVGRGNVSLTGPRMEINEIVPGLTNPVRISSEIFFPSATVFGIPFGGNVTTDFDDSPRFSAFGLMYTSWNPASGPRASICPIDCELKQLQYRVSTTYAGEFRFHILVNGSAAFSSSSLEFTQSNPAPPINLSVSLSKGDLVEIQVEKTSGILGNAAIAGVLTVESSQPGQSWMSAIQGVAPGNSVDRFFMATGHDFNFTGTISEKESYAIRKMKIKDLCFYSAIAPGAGSSFTASLMVNGTEASSVTLSGTDTVATSTNSVDIEVGDEICFRTRPINSPVGTGAHKTITYVQELDPAQEFEQVNLNQIQDTHLF